MAIKIGMIGAGVISGIHLDSLQDICEAEVSAITDLNEEILNRQAQEYNIPHKWTDYHKVLDDKGIELVYICVPHYLHCPIVVEAFEAGKHVVCEKPLSMTGKEADRMISAAKRANRKLFIAENHRFLPENIMARKLIKSGQIGRPFMCMSCFIGNEIERMNDPCSWKGTRSKAGGGVIIDNGFHIIDTLRSFFGEVESVTASAGRLVIEAENKEEDTALVCLFFKSGILVELSLTFCARYSNFPPGYVGAGLRYDICGTEGSLHLVNDMNNAISLITSSGVQVLTSEDIRKNLPKDAPVDMSRHFIDCLLNDCESLVTAQDAQRAMHVIDACYESVGTGKKILIENYVI